MKGTHVSEMEIQRYVFDKDDCPIQIAAHIETCDSCSARAANYQMIFSEIKQYPKPVLDFDLEKMVLAKLPKPVPAFSFVIFLACALSILLIAGLGVFAYLHNEILVRLFTGILPIAIYLIMITAATVIMLQSLDMYKKYQRKMHALKSM